MLWDAGGTGGGVLISAALAVGPGETSCCEAIFLWQGYSLRCYRSSQPATSCCHRLPASAALQTWRWLLQRLWERWWAGQHVVSDQNCYCHPKPVVLAGPSPGCDMGFLRALLTGWQLLWPGPLDKPALTFTLIRTTCAALCSGCRSTSCPVAASRVWGSSSTMPWRYGCQTWEWGQEEHNSRHRVASSGFSTVSSSTKQCPHGLAQLRHLPRAEWRAWPKPAVISSVWGFRLC